MKEKNRGRVLWSLFLAVPAAFALAVDIPALVSGSPIGAWSDLIFHLFETMNGDSVPFQFLFIGLFFLFYGLLPNIPRFYPSALLTGGLFAAFLLFGQSYAFFNSWELVFGSRWFPAVSMMLLFGYTLLLYVLLAAVFAWLDRLWGNTAECVSLRGKTRWYLFGGIIFLVWLPCLLICYPGSMTYDGLYQLGQYFGETALTNHHPYLSTMIMGTLMKVGRLISSDFGAFLYVLLQSVVCAGVFGAICDWLGRSLHRSVGYMAVVYYAIIPTWSAYAQMYVKDTLFYGVFALYFLCVVIIILRNGKNCGKAWCGLLLAGVLCTLLRNNGLYIAAPSALCLVFAVKHIRERAFSVGIALTIFCVHLVFSQAVLPALGVEAGSVREMLSLPFQQTARYAVECGSDLTEDDIQIINDVLDYDVIVAQYNPCVSDPVKDTYHGDSRALAAYFGLWLRCGLDRPTIYIQATLNSMFGYFLPGYRYGEYGGHYFLTQPEKYGFAFEFAHPDAVHLLDGLNRLWSVLPGLSVLNSPGLYAWLLILCTVAMLRKKYIAELVLTVPLWLTLAINCVSPVNGLLRYALPMMAVMPLLIGGTILIVKQSKTRGSS